MTREEAIELLDQQTQAEALKKYGGGWPGVNAMNKALQIAIVALHVQQTPAKLDRSRWEGCDNCTAGDGELRCLLSKWGDGDFCSRCGRPLTEEAWAELERKIKGD